MELLDGVVEFAGDVGNGMRGVGFPENGFEHLAHLASGDAAQKSQQNEVLNGSLAARIAREQLRTKAFASARDTQPGEETQLDDQIAEVEAAAAVETGPPSVFVVSEIHIAITLGDQ